ncbi:hypothetical protein ACFLRO_01065 [Bacteroidota bacterium]
MVENHPANSTKSTYGFRVRFYLPPGSSFEGASPELELDITQIDQRLVLRHLPHGRNQTPDTPEAFKIDGQAFATEEEARRAGARIK